jgi:Tol biopolymer transport system component
LLRRCLEKDSKRRLRDIGEARIEIDETVSRPAPPEAPATQERDQPARWRAPAFAALAVAVVAALAIVFWPRGTSQSGWTNPLENARFTRLTDFPGTEALAEISPDGRFVVFRSDLAREGEWDLWLTQVGTGTFRNLTEDVPSLGPANPIVRLFGFSGDGAQVWFRPTGAPRAIEMPLLGGTPRPYLGERVSSPAWSKDGARMAYFSGVDGDPVFLANATGGESRQIHVDKVGLHNHNPVWSTDGQWIYFVHGYAETDEMDVWRIRPSGGTAERMTQRSAAATFLAPLDSRTLLYVAHDDDRSGPWLWALDIESRISHKVTPGLEQYRSVAASYDGRRVVATVANPTATLWSVPILDRLAEDSDVKPYPVPTVRALWPRFDKTSLYYLSARGTGDGLWRFRDGEASEIWNGSDGALDQPPAVSPDGRSAAVVLRKDGRRQLTMMTTDGADAHALAPSINVLGAVDWSHDGRSIVTGGSDEKGPGLFKVPIDGGAPVRLVNEFASDPDWSPDGSLIVYAGQVVKGRRQFFAVRPDGSAVGFPQIDVAIGRQSFRILPDGKGLVYVPLDKQGDFWLMDFSSKGTRPVAQLNGVSGIRGFDITPDGKQIVFDRVRENSDIVLIEIPAR